MLTSLYSLGIFYPSINLIELNLSDDKVISESNLQNENEQDMPESDIRSNLDIFGDYGENEHEPDCF